jgi:uncharacterized protein
MSTAPSGPVRDLARLLQEMRPQLHAETCAFCALSAGAPLPADAIGWFREAEGETVILPVAAARAAGLPVAFEAAWITLEVHSALEAVGLTAAVASALAAIGIPCNVVAALRHDHLFVPVEQGGEALAVLEALARQA